MEATLSLKEEVDLLVLNKFDRYSDKSNVTFEKIRESRFNELKNILTRFNKEYLFNNYLRYILFYQSDQ